MTGKEYQKMAADARRRAGREFGFRQSSYISFKVESGYFFCLFFLADEARLTVKPMYADDLWWDIWDAAENRKEPLSLRGTGAFALSGQVLASYAVAKANGAEALAEMFGRIFREATAEIRKFLTTNSDADAFYPDESKMDCDPDRLLYLMVLIHNGREDEALSIIRDARKNKHRCMYSSGVFSDSYTYIARRCRRSVRIEKLRRLFTDKVLHARRPDNSARLKNAGSRGGRCRRKPWYGRLPGWMYWVLLTPVLLAVMIYFIDLHRRTLYDTPAWILYCGCLAGVAVWLLAIIKDRSLSGIFTAVTAGCISGALGAEVCIGAFDGVNLLFADREPVRAEALVTDARHFHRARGRGDVNRYITVVQLKADGQRMKIDDASLYNVPAGREVVITYRRGLFGPRIFEGFVVLYDSGR